MIVSEFKAWFEGFAESMEGAPNAKQWKRIKEQVAKIDGAPLSRAVFIDRYRLWAPSYLTGTSQPHGIPSISARGSNDGIGNIAFGNDPTLRSGDEHYNTQLSGSRGSMVAEFDSHAAMYAVGKAEAAA